MSQRNKMCLPAVIICGLGFSASGVAHVPYIETEDYTLRSPFIVEDITNSKAVYSFLESADDYDVYSMEVTEPTRIFASTTIPLCPEYGDYSVTFAVVGPGLPLADVDLPIRLRKGEGAVVVRDPVTSVADRDWFYEPYGGRYYFRAPDFVLDDAPPGTYRMIVWHENGENGDYLAVIGEGEYWGPEQRAQAAKVIPALDAREDLNVACDEAAAVAALKGGKPLLRPSEAVRSE